MIARIIATGFSIHFFQVLICLLFSTATLLTSISLSIVHSMRWSITDNVSASQVLNSSFDIECRRLSGTFDVN